MQKGWIIIWVFAGMSLFVNAAEANPILPHADVIIDVGHGGIDGGTFYGNILEKDINLAVSKKTYKALSQKGYRTILTRDKDYALSEDNSWLKTRSRHKRDLAQRKQIANEIRPHVVISLHTNWAKDASERGPIVLYQNNSNSILLAGILQHTLNEYFQINNSIVYGKKFFILKQIKAPCVIVEMGFISNIEDRRRLTDPREQTRIAEAICLAVDEYFKMLHPM